MTPDEVWDAAIAFVLDEEGVHADDPSDPGQDTWYGISRRSHPALEPWPPSRDQAIQIYKTDYWTAHRCGELPPPLALALFDAVVNQGDSAVKLLQQALAVPPDGIVGPDTVASAARRDPLRALESFLARRAVRYAGLGPFEVYGLTWMGRLFRLQSTALRMETGGGNA